MDTSPLPSNTPPRAGGIDISNNAQVTVYGDQVGRDKIIGYTAEQVRVLLTEISTSYQPKPFDGRSPYIGLAAFQEQDADRFFGRETLTQELVARVETSRFVVIAGPSGSGKSSVVRAGLFPALKRGALAGSENWLYEILAPSRHPLAELSRVVASFTKSLNAGDELEQRGRADATLLHRWADIALGDQRARRAILLVDQFEESFTQVADESERAAFFNLLLYAATIENGRVTIVCVTRSDFIGNWAAYPNLNAQLSRGVNQIPPMQDDELVSAIARPALQVGLRIDPELVKQILDDMRDAPGALPLMQFALQDLFEYEKSKGGVIALTRDDYLERGGLHQALARHADAEFAKLNADEQQIARSVFAGLIEPGRGTVDTKRTALFQELVPAASDSAQVKNVIEKLATARLITTDEVNQRETVTLAHERLIDAWTWLRKLVDENREAIALQNQIAEDAQEWEQHGRDASYLYAGARLATAQEQLREKKIVLGALAQEFVDAGVKAREEAKRKAERRTRRLIYLIGAAAVVFAVLAIFAFTRQLEAEHQQRIARSRELAALARSQFDADPYDSKRDLATLIAIEANKEPDAITFESQDALREFISKYPLKRVLRGHENIVRSAQFSPDGKRIVTASDDQTARVWDAESSNEPVVLGGHEGGVISAQFSPNGAQILTISYDGTARVWDPNSGKQLAVLIGRNSWVPYDVFTDPVNTPRGGLECYGGCARFSSDGSKIVIVGCDKVDENFSCLLRTARVWDVAASLDTASGKEIAVLSEDKGDIVSAQFSPDGNKIVTLGCHNVENRICSTDTMRMWESTSGKEIAVRRVDEENVVSAQFSPALSSNDVLIVTNNSDDKVRVLDAITGAEIVVLQGIAYDVISAQISPDGKQIVTVGVGVDGATPRVWDMASGEQQFALTGHASEVTRAQFSSDGKLILTASLDERAARVWDAKTALSDRRELAILRGHDNILYSAQFSPDGSKVVTASADETARVWDAFGGQEVAILRGHTFALDSAQFSPDGSEVITTSEREIVNGYEAPGTARLWDAFSGKELASLRGHTIGVTRAQFASLDGERVLSVGCDKEENNSCAVWTARVWDVTASIDTEGGRQLARISVPEKRLWTARISPDGKWVVTVGCAKPTRSYCVLGTVRMWDASKGKEIAVLRGKEHITGAEFSSNGNQLVTFGCEQPNQDNTCERGAAWIWNVADLLENRADKEITALLKHTDWIRTAQFSRDGKWIVTVSRDKTSRLWDAANGNELAILGDGTRAITSAQFSPDGTRFATVHSGGTISVWDTASHKLLDTLNKTVGSFAQVQFSPIERKLVTLGDDEKVQLWDDERGEELTLLYGHASRVYDAQFSPDGKWIVTAGWDKTARIHLVNIQDVIELAKKRIGRELTCDERIDYLREEIVCPTPTPEASPTP